MTITVLRQHQTAALTSVINEMTINNGSAVGRIVMPTGAGKTFVEAAVIDHQINNRVEGFTSIHLVLAPRILLAKQLIKEFRNYGGTTYRAIAFHSGTHEPDYEKIKWQEEATTNLSTLKDEYRKSIKSNTDLVVFSTYHSCDKLAGIKFDTIIADESQYCVSENFNNAIKSLVGRVRLFFTATERHTASNNGRGLNNETVYGKRLFSIKPAELIKIGLIVPPRLHIMHATTKDESRSILDEVIKLAKEQDKLTGEELNFSKILFAMKGTDDVKTIVDNFSKIKKELPQHNIFTITSKIGAMIDGVKVRREIFLEKLKNAKNALIFHYDILSEGIDVDGITGIALMRNLGLAKLLQTIGRAVRIYKPNPEAKRQAWISVPVLNGDEDDKEQVSTVVRAIRDGGIDISAEDVIETGKPRHHADEENVDDAYGKHKLNMSLFSIANVLHEIEQDAFWAQVYSAATVDEKLDLLLG
jgi:superfamily II DNA or RNA helicase